MTQDEHNAPGTTEAIAEGLRERAREIEVDEPRVAEGGQSAFLEWKAAGFGRELLPLCGHRHSCQSPGKRPHVSAWQKMEVTPTLIERWARGHCGNVGLRTRFFPAVDLDIEDSTIADACERVALVTLGSTARRTRANTPRRLLLFRLKGEPFSKRMIAFTTPAGAKAKIEVLADGQQAVVAGIHHTGAAIEWAGQPIAADLAPMTADLCDALVSALRARLADLECRVEGADAPRSPGRAPAAHAKAPGASEKVIAEGERNTRLTSIAGRLRVQGLGVEGIRTALAETNAIRCRPPLPEREIDTIARSIGGRPATYPLTDAGNAERFVGRHGRAVRYAHGWGRWLLWDDSRWAPDACGEVRELAVETARSLHMNADLVDDAKVREKMTKHALGSERRDRIMAALDLASSMAPIAVVPDGLDRDPDLLNVVNGEIDLRTGRLLPHEPAHLMTKLAPVAYDPAAEAPSWRFFLERVFPDPEVRAYVQRAAGYSLTGNVGEHCVFFAYGMGANGKSTFIETLREMLGEGEYAKAAQPDLLLAKKQERHAVELADLRGMRLVSTVEAGEGRAWDEVRVKWLTGGDTISARFMYGNPFSFTPTHKFWVSANHKPRVSGTDLGFWRRVHLIPWTVTIPESERDPELCEKLRAEFPGILRWALDGCLEWRRAGLRPPAAVLAATADYRFGEDVLGAFLNERCLGKGDGKIDQPSLFAEYRQWGERSGERILSARTFGTALEERGYRRERSHGRTWILGLVLRQDRGDG